MRKMKIVHLIFLNFINENAKRQQSLNRILYT